MHALAQLIEDTKQANGWSNGDVARRSDLTRTHIQQLVAEPVKRMSTLRVVKGLATGLGVPAWVVVDAMLDSLGYPHRPSRVSVEEAIDADPELSTDQKRALRGFLQHLNEGGSSVREVIPKDRPRPN